MLTKSVYHLSLRMRLEVLQLQILFLHFLNLLKISPNVYAYSIIEI